MEVGQDQDISGWEAPGTVFPASRPTRRAGPLSAISDRMHRSKKYGYYLLVGQPNTIGDTGGEGIPVGQRADCAGLSCCGSLPRPFFSAKQT
jgi:hypothetical protein